MGCRQGVAELACSPNRIFRTVIQGEHAYVRAKTLSFVRQRRQVGVTSRGKTAVLLACLPCCLFACRTLTMKRSCVRPSRSSTRMVTALSQPLRCVPVPRLW